MSDILPLDLAIGGGGCYFLPKSSPYSCRNDELNLVALAKEQGWNAKLLFGNKAPDGVLKVPASDVHYTKFTTQSYSSEEEENILSSNLDLPLLALLAPQNTPYEIDRRVSQPSLSSLALKALDTLDKSPTNKKGFLIMIEGSQIDLCAHQNDPACHAREIEAYQQTIDKVSAWVEEKNKGGEDTILISTSDHETGGLTLGRQLGPDYPSE